VKSSLLKVEKYHRSSNLSLKKLSVEILVLVIVNCILIYCLLFFIPDTSIAMIGIVWVCIIAWRGGIIAALITCLLVQISCFVVFAIPPHNSMKLPMQLYIDNRMPGVIISTVQCIVCGLVVGYISTLVHSLRQEISLRKKYQKDLELKVAELDIFGRTVAHDLKNPLMIMDMSIELLKSELSKHSIPNVQQALSFLNSSNKQMTDIIESILVLAGIKKIDENEFGIISISHTVDCALQRLSYNIELNGVQVKKPDDWPSVVGYAPWVVEVWVNYLSNAIKYGGDPYKLTKPIVEIGFDSSEMIDGTQSQHIRFWVKDNGVGIQCDEIERLFTEFTRLQSTKYKGFGLGLSIVKTIVSKLNGTVGVESEVGRGSLFYFTLPTTQKLV
jgi:signal transduction histidine kinase